MPDTTTKLLIEAIQPRAGRGGWHGGPTPLGALRGVTAAEAAWTPPHGKKSIWQLALHVAYCKYAVRRRLEGGKAPRFPRTPANWPRVPKPASARAWEDDIALLREQHERLITVARAVPRSRYGAALPHGKRWTMGELITGIALHDAYHAGQIQMLKRLWAGSHVHTRG